MNDFTKEELYKICAIVTSHFCDIGIASVDKDLINKIERVIDNYCEHDYRSMGNHNWLHCIKCRNDFFFTETKI